MKISSAASEKCVILGSNSNESNASDQSLEKTLSESKSASECGNRIDFCSEKLSLRALDISRAEVFARVKTLRCKSEFVEDIALVLARIKGNELMHPYVMSVRDDLVGYFCVDLSYGNRVAYVPDGGAGLIDYFVDSRYQGLGIGKQAVAQLPFLLKKDFPNLSAIYLAVNHRNPGAKHCYESAGFKVFGNGYVASAGPGDVMKLELD